MIKNITNNDMGNHVINESSNQNKGRNNDNKGKAKISLYDGSFLGCITGVYGSPYLTRRAILWKELMQLGEGIQELIMCI